MILRKTKSTERSFFYFASFGAASLLALVISSFVALLFSVSGTDLSFSATLWIFLFLFPATLAFSTSFIASKLESIEMPNLIYAIIIGYGAYSIISLFILLLGGRNEPALWTLLILALISTALFNTGTILARFGIREDDIPADTRATRALDIPSPILPIKIISLSRREGENMKPIFSIKKHKESPEKKESTSVDMHGGGGVIHLGPRS